MSPAEPQLSLIVPLRGALDDFARALGLNERMLARDDVELVIVLGDARLEVASRALMQRHPGIRWVLQIVGAADAAHWRAHAINAGLRCSRGDFVLVCHEAVAFVSDVITQVQEGLRQTPGAVILGRCSRASVAQWRGAASLSELFSQTASQQIDPASLSALTGVARHAFEVVGGYDESIAGDEAGEDNLRIRLESAGYGLVAGPHVQAVCISDVEVSASIWPDVISNAAAYAPPLAKPRNGAPSHVEPPRANSEQHESVRHRIPGHWIPVGSLRICPVCYRYVRHQPVRPYCALCAPHAAQIPGSLRIVCVMQVRNEGRFLRGCLDHLRPYVDGFVILDDGSTDETSSVLDAEPGLLVRLQNPVTEPHHWDEKGNKERLLNAAKEVGADWVLVCDADERLETMFLRHLRAIAAALVPFGLPCVSLALRELWDRPDQYRVDGVWGRKRAARFFALPAKISFHSVTELHGNWHPDEVAARGRLVLTGYHLYHLRMINAADREARRDRYKRLDPDNRFQSIGYDYLTDTSNGLALSPVDPERAYAYPSLCIS